MSNQETSKQEVDMYRDTWVRFLGYTNEVGESFRSLVVPSVVKASYLVAATYCLADTVDKTMKVPMESDIKSVNGRSSSNNSNTSSTTSRLQQQAVTAGDTFLWQMLASVIVPGLTINRLCASSLFLLNKYSRLAVTRNKWITTGIGLASIPFIIHPIDHAVDMVMDKTIRTIYQ